MDCRQLEPSIVHGVNNSEEHAPDGSPHARVNRGLPEFFRLPGINGSGSTATVITSENSAEPYS